MLVGRSDYENGSLYSWFITRLQRDTHSTRIEIAIEALEESSPET
jgi:hypothetical protein